MSCFAFAGFIDFIVAPTLEVCGDLLDKIRALILGSTPANLTEPEEVMEEVGEGDMKVTDSKSRAKSLGAMRTLQRSVLSVDSGTDSTSRYLLSRRKLIHQSF